MNEIKEFLVRIPKEVFEELKESSKFNRRSINQEIIFLLEKWLVYKKND